MVVCVGVLTHSLCVAVCIPDEHQFRTGVCLLFLLFEAILFAIFTGVMFGTQLCAICNDETVGLSLI